MEKKTIANAVWTALASTLYVALWYLIVPDQTLTLVLLFPTVSLLFRTFHQIATYQDYVVRRHLSFYFMNHFILNLSVKATVPSTLKDLYPQLPTPIRHAMDQYEGLIGFEVLERLVTLFDFSLYQIFLNVVQIFVLQGGSILEMADMVLARARRIEIKLNEGAIILKRKLGQFIVLWGLNFVIIFFMRFILVDVFAPAFSQWFFRGFMLIFFILCLVSFERWVASGFQFDPYE